MLFCHIQEVQSEAASAGGRPSLQIHTHSKSGCSTTVLLTLNKYCFGALRALETPEEKLVRRAIRNEKDRARRKRAKTKQKQVAK